MSEIDYKDQTQKAEKARQLLKDPMLTGCLDDMTKYWFDEIKKTKANQTEQREHCYRMIRCVEDFKGQFLKVVKTGVVAQSKLDEVKRTVSRLIRTEY